MNKIPFKKLLALLLVLSTVMTIAVACGSKDSDDSKKIENATETSAGTGSTEAEPTYSTGLRLEPSSNGEFYVVAGLGKCTDTDIKIPPTYNSKPVGVIGKGAFKDSTIESIVLTEKIQIIDDEAFKGCSSLESISLSNNITSIGSEAFSGCISLESITLPESIGSFGEKVFSGCTSITSIDFPTGITELTSGMCENCEALTTVSLPDTVTYLHGSAFSNCSSLTTINYSGTSSQFDAITLDLSSDDDFAWQDHTDIKCADDNSLQLNITQETLNIDRYIKEGSEIFNFNGATFTYLGGGSQVPDEYEETGNIASDALYYRQRAVEKSFSVTFDNRIAESGGDTSVHPTVELVTKDSLAGTGSYDLIYGTLPVTMSPLFTSGCLSDISDFSSVNLNQEWWPASLQYTHSIGGEMFFLTGPIMTTYYSDAQVVLFNKDLTTDYNIEGLYEDVLNYSWTFDKMFEQAQAIPDNDSGTGEYRYGAPSGLGIMFAHGMTLTQFDINGIPFVGSSLPSTLSDLADKFSAVMSDDVTSAYCRPPENIEDKYGYESFGDMFAGNNILFYFTTLGKAQELRSYDVNFGILPMPMGDYSQSQYYSYADNFNTFYCAVPVGARDREMTDVITEAMAALSLKYLKPAYYDILLKSRSTNDSDSKAMLDIIMDSKIYDIVDLYDPSPSSLGSYATMFDQAIAYDSSSFASKYFMQSKIASKKIESLLKNINK